MQAIEIIGTALLIMIVAMGGAYLGMVAGSGGDVDEAPALISLNRTIELPPVSVPVYEDGARIGYCVVTAQIEMPNSFTDEQFQIAAAEVADDLIRSLSTIEAGQDAEALCMAELDGAVGDGTAIEVSYYRTIRAITGAR